MSILKVGTIRLKNESEVGEVQLKGGEILVTDDPSPIWSCKLW